MTIDCPSCQWPTVLEERGPSDDPSILLTGIGRLGETPIQIIAIRVNPTSRSTLDWQPELEGIYQANDLDTVLGTILEELDYASAELGRLLGEDRSATVELTTGLYKVWSLSASFGA
jgi:hypothetical protein